MEYDDRNLLKDLAVLRDGFDSVRRELAKVIVGQENVIEKVLSAMPGAEGAPKSQKVLEINADHPIFAALQSLQEKGESEKLGKYARILYDQALLSEQGSLKDPNAFLKLMNELIG